IENSDLAISLPGRFNVENALAAITVSLIYGIPTNYIKSGLKKATVPGRMEVFQSKDKSITAIVDYAHNQLSFETLFKTVQEEYPGHSIIAVFGCPGGKAYARRQQLPIAAGRLCDMIYVTEEDAGEEPVDKISQEIAENIKVTGCNYDIINDRGDAILAALSYSKRPLVACITGKGRETRQKRGIQYIDCMSDVQYVVEFLTDYDNSSMK
ncbi:MAG: UDP-N-acetylmuramoyl-L-alanyl-D-glutamate--2,6-diaminopimelate ligase, partial [Lachnospiraceae bacterium]|nr:UDP-N-acetylmuramoyl-L-alanyl-D-glutamate--2,6-diaminopimelate ligase [Lachnospiraceae bacterium]